MSEENVASPGGTGNPGEAAPTWQEQFLAGEEFAEIRDNETIKTTPDIPTLAKNLIHNKSLVGRKGVIIPKEDAPPEEWDRFHAELGRPATPEAYEIKPEGLPENFPYSPELESGFRKLAHQAGLSNKSAQQIYKGYLHLNLEEFQKAQTALQSEVAELQAGLQTEWGSKYEENLGLARRAMQRVAPAGSPELLALDKVIGDSPVLVKFFYGLGKSMGEGDFVSGGGGGNSTLEARRQELMGSEAYLKENHPDHKKIVEEVSKIYEQLYPQPENQ